MCKGFPIYFDKNYTKKPTQCLRRFFVVHNGANQGCPL